MDLDGLSPSTHILPCDITISLSLFITVSPGSAANREEIFNRRLPIENVIFTFNSFADFYGWIHWVLVNDNISPIKFDINRCAKSHVSLSKCWDHGIFRKCPWCKDILLKRVPDASNDHTLLEQGRNLFELEAHLYFPYGGASPVI